MAAAIFCVLFTSCGDDGPSTPVPGPWLAVISSAPDTWGQPSVAAIRAQNLATGAVVSFGPAADYVLLTWSPDGTRLAALHLEQSDTVPETSGRLRVWRADGHLLSESVMRPATLAWSPDGTRLAATGGSGITIFDRNGKELGQVSATPTASGGYQSALGAGFNTWSPNSGFAVALINSLLLVVDRDGHGTEHDLPEFKPVAPEQVSSISPVSWVAPRSVRILERTGVLEAMVHVGTVSRTRIDWSPPAPFDIASIFVPNPQRREVEGLVPGLQVAASKPSADGSATTWLLHAERTPGLDQPVRGAFAVMLPDNQRVIVDPGDLRSSMLNRSTFWFDLVVIPGDSGALPATVTLSTVRVQQPQPTSVQPTPGYFPPPDPAVGVPYPRPQGDKVTPKVSGLPVFPGAMEIDGFAKDVSGTEAAVQQNATDESLDDVLAFYERELTAAGYRKSGGSAGSSGEAWDYIRGRDRVLVSTVYVPRPEDELPPGAPPYGFREKGVRFLEGADGKQWFWIVTVRAE